MATFNQMLFFMQFLILIGILILKLYNISAERKYSYMTNIVLFVLATLCFGAGFISIITAVDDILLIQLFKITIGVYLLTGLFFVIDLFVLLGEAIQANTKQAYNAIQNGKNGRI